MIKRTVLVLLSFLMLCTFVSCAALEPFERGEVLSAEEVEARRDALLAEKETEKESEKVDTPFDGTCYWLKSGSVYHISLDCTYIAGKDNLLSGSVAQASAAGKTKACSRCGKAG